MSNLGKMLEVVKNFQIGGPIRVREYQGVVTAFNDEHLFCSIPEIALTPDEIDLGAKRARDREVEGLRNRIRTLEIELERMINDHQYAERRQYEARRNREWRRERDFNAMDYGIDMIRPVYRGVKPWVDEGGPRVEKFIDELQFKSPTQKKG